MQFSATGPYGTLQWKNVEGDNLLKSKRIQDTVRREYPNSNFVEIEIQNAYNWQLDQRGNFPRLTFL